MYLGISVSFFGDFNAVTPKRRSSHHTHTNTLTNTLTFTHTHMTGQPRLVGQVVQGGFWFLQMGFKGTTSGQQKVFGPTGGHATFQKNIFLRARKLFQLLCLL